jgi:transposase
MTTAANKKWSDENVAALTLAGQSENPVTAATVAKLAEDLKVSARSVASKLRQLDIPVASLAVAKVPSFTAEEGADLKAFVENNFGAFTYKDIAEQFNGGQFNAKQVQGKILALELTAGVKATEKVEAVRTYSDAEEETFISMVKAGAFIEDIAAKLNKSIASIRGKGLSLTRQDKIAAIPAQKESHAKDSTDAVDALGDKVATMTVAEIAAATEKTERGIKTLLTRRGINVADYKGADKAAKNAGKVAA